MHLTTIVENVALLVLHVCPRKRFSKMFRQQTLNDGKSSTQNKQEISRQVDKP